MTAKKSVCFVSVPFLSRKDSGADEMNLKSVALGRVGTNRRTLQENFWRCRPSLFLSKYLQAQSKKVIKTIHSFR